MASNIFTYVTAGAKWPKFFIIEDVYPIYFDSGRINNLHNGTNVKLITN